MRDPFGAAAPAIFAAFADPEQVIYVQPSGALPPLRAVRSDETAPGFSGAGSTLRKVSYEIRQADLPDRPTKRDKLIHRGRLWAIDDITQRDDIGAWELVVSDAGG